MSVAARIVLFVSSYAPLLILFAVLKSFGPGWPSRFCVIVGIGSVALLIVGWMVTQRTLAFNYLEFEGARSRDADVMAYVVSYVVPFAAATNADDPTSCRKKCATLRDPIRVPAVQVEIGQGDG